MQTFHTTQTLSTAEINTLLNAYNGAISEAENLHARYLETPSIQLLADESLRYKTISEICGLLAQKHSRSPIVREDWLAKQRRADARIRELVRLANNEPEPESTPVFPDVGQDPAEAQTAQKRTGKPKSSGGRSRSGDEITDETVQSWIREAPEHGFEGVAGMHDLVDKLKKSLPNPAADMVKDHMGVSRVNGIFLYGPPGCGKTHCIKAFIHELMKDNESNPPEERYTYMFLSGSDIHDKYVGGAEQRVKRAFEEAQKRSPCILFIDEIENVCRDRNTPNLPGHAWATTAQFLNSFNDLVSSKKKVFFIGATNYPNMVEGAMLDRVKLIPVPLPDAEAREKRFEMLLAQERRLKLEAGFCCMDMAKATINYSYRDFDHLVEDLTNAMIEELLPIYGEDGKAMVEAMTSGAYPLRRDLFMKVLSNYRPSKKDDIIRSLDAWDSKIQKSPEG